MKTVLIIDDHVFEAGEGEAGLALVRQHRPQIVLCDLLMPRGNGFQVCRELRANPALRHIRIIVTTGRDYEADRQSACDAGADAYLTKPISAEAILKAIGKLLPRVASENPPAAAPAAAAGKTTPVRVKFWGVRGSIPTPGPATVQYGGNTSCVEVRAGDEIIILDAGTGLRQLGRALMAEFKDRPLRLTLLLTHTHWDHIQGLPFFAPVYSPNCRLRILGYEGARKSLVHVLSGQMESPYFPVPFQELPGNIEIEELKDLHFHVGAVRGAAWFANHPGICVGYRLFTADGDIVYIPDNEPIMRHRVETAIWPKQGRDAVTFAQDEEEKMIAFLHGTDVLILDSQYDREEYQHHVGWGHGCVDDAVALALRAEAKKLFLFHHDPDHDDAKISSMVDYAQKLVAEQKAELAVAAAREGEVIEFAPRSSPPPA
ncbi:MAG: response regulator [Verrucomicrobia bacterium]|nr:response regulator [Verrucomicrobiota bacterium]